MTTNKMVNDEMKGAVNKGKVAAETVAKKTKVLAESTGNSSATTSAKVEDKKAGANYSFSYYKSDSAKISDYEKKIKDITDPNTRVLAELLLDLKKTQDEEKVKADKGRKISWGCSGAAIVLFVICVIAIVPKLVGLMNNVNTVLASTNELIAQGSAIVSEGEAIVAQAQGAFDNVMTIVDETGKTISDATGFINDIMDQTGSIIQTATSAVADATNLVNNAVGQTDTVINQAVGMVNDTEGLVKDVIGQTNSIMDQAVGMVDQAQGMVGQAQGIVTDTETVVDQVAQVDINGIVAQVVGLVNNANGGIQDIVDLVSTIDIESINNAIGDIGLATSALSRAIQMLGR